MNPPTTSLVRIADHPAKGRILLATQDIRAGQLVSSEAPLMVAKFPGLSGLMGSFQKLSPEAQEEVLRMHSPMNGLKVCSPY